ncbi:MAG: GNAT family N-acetyltransferase [Ruminococcaceae bacterium]|nr:GNAT family N-acetyltransferase [Oscillospiraceae bacterium]
MINAGFEIRNAAMEDAEQIQQITHEAFEKYIELAGIDGTIAALEESIEDIKKDIAENLVLVAYINGRVVGSVRVKLTEDHTAYLSRFGVNPNFQNLGIGKALMNLVDINMKVLGVKQLQLHTGAKITGLVRFYYGRGFYIDSTNKDRGYIRALLCKDYA